MRHLAASLLGMILALNAAAASPAPTTKAARPTQAVAPSACVTPQCHPAVKSAKVLHGPVGDNACDACHALADAKAHTFKVTRQGADLCTYCHEFDVSDLPVIHQPVARGQCLGCHDPHGGNNHALTREDSTPQLCGRCHESITHDKAFLHGPVAQGQCDSCHPPHASRFPKLLDAVGTDLCLTCHVEFSARIGTVKFTHKALDKGCEQCHDVHGSNYPMSLRQSAPDLCLDCHKKLKARIAAAQYKHPPVTSERACLTCHTPHGSDLAKLLSDLPSKVCMSCHKQPIKQDNKLIVAAVPEVLDKTMLKHGPIKDGQCGGCHAVHGGDQPALLSKTYSRTYYQPFAPDQYDLCFSCHDVRLARQEPAGDVTRFRNGTHNLHYVHVSQGTRDHNCRLCHSDHASHNERLVADSVRYGKYELPIGFAATATGGSCAPGCHGESRYDREHPVATTTTTAPATRPALLIARAERQPATSLEWSARTVTGAQVNVPDPLRPTLLLLVHTDSAARQALKAVAAALPDPARAQVLLVQKKVSKLISDPNRSDALTPPVIADPDDALSRALGVFGWPTVLLIDSHGTEIARLSGSAESLAWKLAPYMDLATGRTDRATATSQTTQPAILTDNPAPKASRELQLARQLLAEGKAEQAGQLLAGAVKQDPDLPALQVEMVRALTQQKRGSEALDLLRRLPAAAISPDRRDLLRAEAMISMNDWPQAKAVLAAAIQRRPASAEAHYLLGRIYEHDQDWPKAAQEYRAAHERAEK